MMVTSAAVLISEIIVLSLCWTFFSSFPDRKGSSWLDAFFARKVPNFQSPIPVNHNCPYGKCQVHPCQTQVYSDFLLFIVHNFKGKKCDIIAKVTLSTLFLITSIENLCILKCFPCCFPLTNWDLIISLYFSRNINISFDLVYLEDCVYTNWFYM